MSSSLSRELVFLILQSLDEDKSKETVHKLEQESGFFFNMKYFEELAEAGEWDKVESYLSGFTKVDDNRYSMKIFFEIRKQKYMEALDGHDRAKAVKVLVKDLKVFSAFNEELYKEITHLLTLDNFRENAQLSKYGDTKSARSVMLLELKKLIEANPLFRDKLTFPELKTSRLRTLINHSLNWQHQLCKNPCPNPDIKTLFTDHSCGSSNGARVPPPGVIPMGGPFSPFSAHASFPPAGSTPVNQFAGWIANPNPPTPSHAGAVSVLKRPRALPGSSSMTDYQTADSDHLLKRARQNSQADEMSYQVTSLSHTAYFSDDLPKEVARTLIQGSSVMSMDFHPSQQTLLLVGTNVGDIAIWEVSSNERLVQKPFKVWELGACSMLLQDTLIKDPGVSVNKTAWSPDGQVLGVVFSKHIVHVYHYHGGSDLRPHQEIDAHAGSVNDLAFSHPNRQLCIITCGDDKTIKVWEAGSGRMLYCFEGHEAPVFSVCPHQNGSIQFIFSTAVDGKIKAWLYDLVGSRVDYDAPGHSCTTMAYSTDGTRLFSCGTSKDGESFLVEWNESEGSIKRRYPGFRKRSEEILQFDTTRNRFLAVGDDFQIKFWDMDNPNILTATDADGGLSASPRLCFNKEGSLLAVTTNDNRIKILATADELRLLRDGRAFEISRGQPDLLTSKVPSMTLVGIPGGPVLSGVAGADRIASSGPVSGLREDRVQVKTHSFV